MWFAKAVVIRRQGLLQWGNRSSYTREKSSIEGSVNASKVRQKRLCFYRTEEASLEKAGWGMEWTIIGLFLFLFFIKAREKKRNKKELTSTGLSPRCHNGQGSNWMVGTQSRSPPWTEVTPNPLNNFHYSPGSSLEAAEVRIWSQTSNSATLTWGTIFLTSAVANIILPTHD